MSLEENKKPSIPVRQKSYTPVGTLGFIGVLCAALEHA